MSDAPVVRAPRTSSSSDPRTGSSGDPRTRLGSDAAGAHAAPSSWRPTASLTSLRRRAALLARTREFFAARGVLEVETPILSLGAVSDPNIESLATRIAGLPRPYYLNTSPEFPMKRLLAAGSGDIYQICKVFRDAERGRWHNNEFTMLEWYRLGFDDAALMDEVEALVSATLEPQNADDEHRHPGKDDRVAPALRLTYAAALRQHAGVDAHEDGETALARAIADHGIVCDAALDRDAMLDLLMGVVVGPKLGLERPCFICDYPASQASLARIKPGLPKVAARFELYIDGIEIANGFHELVNAQEQRARFMEDIVKRHARGQVEPPLDEHLLAALAHGLPDCAGVALGFDRLVAIALGVTRLPDAMAFSIDNA